MSTSPTQLLSPAATEFDRDDSAPPGYKSNVAASSMLKIQSLLNPSERSRMRGASISPPPTPASTQVSSTASTPVLPASPSLKRKKLVKDAAIFVRGNAKEPVKYPPYECTDDSICLSDHAMEDLAQEQERFGVFPCGRGDEGLIAHYQRHIPYSSEKKMFHGKTNRDAFEVFQYTFRVPPGTVRKQPENFHNKDHVVMWDYQVGLVRITPFFKALVHSKTTPTRAIAANPGLKELSHSITGGALAAQGYWMPYSCARALCLTFCYDIRWALTPIFGTSFIKECLHPTHPGFERYKIGSEVLRCAQLEAEGWVSEASSRGGTPFVTDNSQYGDGQGIPRSTPQLVPAPQPKQLRPRPTFRAGSPFESESDLADANYIHATTYLDSPGLSPKSTRHIATRGWTSVNERELHSAPPPPNNTPVGSVSHMLLTEPRSFPATAWRGLHQLTDAAATMTVKMPTTAHDKHRSHKRRMSVQAVAEEIDYTVPPPTSTPGSESEDDEVGTVLPSTTKKRQRRDSYKSTVSSPPPRSGSSTPAEMRAAGKSTKYNATDMRAAQWLLNLSVRDSQLACGPRGEMKGMKRKASTS
ncbi:hypothetical protein LTR57_006389 [Friedmanniomyces endolithicus]|nr:hypothetical protein LTR57_006389 [Friedmanniomyces endolithicus]